MDIIIHLNRTVINNSCKIQLYSTPRLEMRIELIIHLITHDPNRTIATNKGMILLKEITQLAKFTQLEIRIKNCNIF